MMRSKRKGADAHAIIRAMVDNTTSRFRIDAVTSSLRRVAPDGLVSVYLFGSLAKGRQHRESDVDIAVLFCRQTFPDRKERFEAGLRISAALQAELRTSRIDLVVLNDVPPLFGRRIVDEGNRVFCSDEAVNRAFIRDVQLRAADLLPFLERTQRTKLRALGRS